MTDRFRDRLSEYLDGELADEERALVDRHIAECEACADALAELGMVVARAQTLPEREPGDDLWPRIEARIRAADHGRGRAIGFARRRISLSMPQLAAAAVTLASLSAAGAWFTFDRGPSAAPMDGAASVGPAGGVLLTSDVDAAGADAAEYGRQIAALEQALFNPETTLPPETEAKLRRALVTIDRALEDARRALEQLPDDPYLEQHVTSTMRRKADFLRHAVRLAQG